MGAAGRAAAGANPIKVCFVDGGALWHSYVRGGALWDLCVRGGALWDLYVHGGTLRDVYVALCASCPVRVPSAAFNVPLPSLFGHRSNTEITSFPVGSDARRRPFTGATPGLHVSQPGPGPAPRLAFAGSSGGWRVGKKNGATQSTGICSPVAT